MPWNRNESLHIGFISAISHPFCGDCVRAWASADGRLHLCLFATSSTDLRPFLTHDAQMNSLRERIATAMEIPDRSLFRTPEFSARQWKKSVPHSKDFAGRRIHQVRGGKGPSTPVPRREPSGHDESSLNKRSCRYLSTDGFWPADIQAHFRLPGLQLD